MDIITSTSTLTDVCFAVCTALRASGTTAVLTGGSAATYYAPERYQSRDVDFVITMMRDPKATAAVLADLGFTETGGIYQHPATLYTVDFPPGPLAIGAAVVTEYATVSRRRQRLHVLSRTDSVCDRLAAFYHWDDRSSLRTALDVATSGRINLGKIRMWSVNEGAAEKFQEFAKRFREPNIERR